MFACMGNDQRETLEMKNFSKFIVAVLFFGSPAFGQSECTAIENDIARLQCFDEAFKCQNAPVMSQEQALQKLNELSLGSLQEDGGATMIFQAFDGPCFLRVVALKRGSYYDSLQAVGVEISERLIRLNQVQEMADDFRRPGSLSVSMNKGWSVGAKTLKWAIHARELQGQNDEVLPLIFMDFLNTVNNAHELARRYTDFWVRETNERTESVQIVIEAEDFKEAKQAFETLVSACS